MSSNVFLLDFGLFVNYALLFGFVASLAHQGLPDGIFWNR